MTACSGAFGAPGPPRRGGIPARNNPYKNPLPIMLRKYTIYNILVKYPIKILLEKK